MKHRTRTHMLLATAIVMIVLSVAVPVSVMVGCSMEMPMPMSLSKVVCDHFQGAGEFISRACGGTYQAIDGLADSVAPGPMSPLTPFAALAALAVFLVMPDARGSAPVLVLAAPLPPPEDPLGQRLSI